MAETSDLFLNFFFNCFFFTFFLFTLQRFFPVLLHHFNLEYIKHLWFIHHHFYFKCDCLLMNVLDAEQSREHHCCFKADSSPSLPCVSISITHRRQDGDRSGGGAFSSEGDLWDGPNHTGELRHSLRFQEGSGIMNRGNHLILG